MLLYNNIKLCYPYLHTDKNRWEQFSKLTKENSFQAWLIIFLLILFR